MVAEADGWDVVDPPSLLAYGRRVKPPTPKIATSGALSTGVKDSMPAAPKLVTVKVEPLSNSGSMLPLCAVAIGLKVGDASQGQQVGVLQDRDQ